MISDELRKNIVQSVKLALQEDVGSGDLTAMLIAKDYNCSATLISREAGVFCGTYWLDETFKQVDPSVSICWQIKDGEPCSYNQILCQLTGPARSLFTGERTAMNFIQTLSGTTTQTTKYVNKVAHTKCKILDTRKTLPGMRLAQKYAVLQGGGFNHRVGLFDAILIKENHIQACGGVEAAYQKAKQLNNNVRIEVEVETLNEFKQAYNHKVERILLDNFTLSQINQVIEINQGICELEASGNITLKNISDYAQTGVDYISIGDLTKNINALDLSLRINE